MMNRKIFCKSGPIYGQTDRRTEALTAVSAARELSAPVWCVEVFHLTRSRRTYNPITTNPTTSTTSTATASGSVGSTAEYAEVAVDRATRALLHRHTGGKHRLAALQRYTRTHRSVFCPRFFSSFLADCLHARFLLPKR